MFCLAACISPALSACDAAEIYLDEASTPSDVCVAPDSESETPIGESRDADHSSNVEAEPVKAPKEGESLELGDEGKKRDCAVRVNFNQDRGICYFDGMIKVGKFEVGKDKGDTAKFAAKPNPGYDFKGWYRADDEGNKIDEKTDNPINFEIAVDDDISLWLEFDYSVTKLILKEEWPDKSRTGNINMTPNAPAISNRGCWIP